MIIHIYKADYNLYLTVKWRQLIQEEDHKWVLHHGQFGERPGCDDELLALLENINTS